VLAASSSLPSSAFALLPVALAVALLLLDVALGVARACVAAAASTTEGTCFCRKAHALLLL
jgi:hypothetical protein